MVAPKKSETSLLLSAVLLLYSLNYDSVFTYEKDPNLLTIEYGQKLIFLIGLNFKKNPLKSFIELKKLFKTLNVISWNYGELE